MMHIERGAMDRPQPPIIADYRNGGFHVSLRADGSKVRRRVDPSSPPLHPDSIDLKITDWCDAGCAWCHEASTRRGRHGDIQDILDLLGDLPAGVEIAIGGGDAPSHPQFDRLVLASRDRGLIPSVTVNGRHLARHRQRLESLIARDALFGVGVSLHETIPEWDYEHMVVHAIAGVDDPAVFQHAGRLKLLVLGYKRHGRGLRYHDRDETWIASCIERWYREIGWLAHRHHLSFDTLAIQQLSPQRLFRDPSDAARRFMGEEGEFSMYVDAVRREYAVSSYAAERRPWTRILDMFAEVRHAAGLASSAASAISTT